MKRVVTFLTTRDPEKAIAFYRDTLGFNFVRDDGFALVFDLGAATLRINKTQEHTPLQRTELGWEVENIENAVQDLKGRGVAFSQFPSVTQDERGIATFSNGSRVAWFADPDGNVLSLSQVPPLN
jgi:catechol 2,3-dioxygenase-like lactoylglutathione lyase family enzyme